MEPRSLTNSGRRTTSAATGHVFLGSKYAKNAFVVEPRVLIMNNKKLIRR